MEKGKYSKKLLPFIAGWKTFFLLSLSLDTKNPQRKQRKKKIIVIVGVLRKLHLVEPCPM